MNGFLVIDKPPGITSHDAVAICRRKLGVRRIGHAGTLDPDATGVLVMGIGRGTRLLRFLADHDKEYRAEMILGVETTTQDAGGEVVAQADASRIDRPALERVLAMFRGEIEQLPPMVSAVKVGGEPLYKKARRGETAERSPRRVTIHDLECESFEPGSRAGASIRVRCSKGTYVRTLAHDVGRALGVGGHIAYLRRTASGPFLAEEAAPLDAVGPELLRPLDAAAVGYPRYEIDGDTARRLIRGQTVPSSGIPGTFAVFGPGGLVAMAADGGDRVRTLCVVAEE